MRRHLACPELGDIKLVGCQRHRQRHRDVADVRTERQGGRLDLGRSEGHPGDLGVRRRNVEAFGNEHRRVGDGDRDVEAFEHDRQAARRGRLGDADRQVGRFVGGDDRDVVDRDEAVRHLDISSRCLGHRRSPVDRRRPDGDRGEHEGTLSGSVGDRHVSGVDGGNGGVERDGHGDPARRSRIVEGDSARRGATQTDQGILECDRHADSSRGHCDRVGSGAAVAAVAVVDGQFDGVVTGQIRCERRGGGSGVGQDGTGTVGMGSDQPRIGERVSLHRVVGATAIESDQVTNRDRLIRSGIGHRQVIDRVDRDRHCGVVRVFGSVICQIGE